MDQEAAETLTGQTIQSEVFSVHPTGHLIHVLLETVPEEFGLIKIPDNIRDREKMGVGYIIAAGPRAGHTDFAIPTTSAVGLITSDDPESLLGLHVIFGSHTGMALRLRILDREFQSAVVVMSSKDIRGVDTNPVPLSTRASVPNPRPALPTL